MATAHWTPQQTSQILSFFDKGSLSRGRGYARAGLVHSIAWSGNTLSGRSEGSGGKTYACRVNAVFDGARAQVTATCSCPVSIYCKHCVALILTATDASKSEALPPAQPPRPPAGALELSRWRTLVTEITTPVNTAESAVDRGPELPLALQFSLDLDARGNRRVYVRPMTHGARGRWVASRVTWKSLLTTRRPGDNHDPAALALLVDIGGILAARTQRSTPPDTLPVSSAPSRIWPVLAQAADAGIEFIGTGGWGQPQTVAFDAGITTGLRVERMQNHLNVGVEVLVGGRAAAPPHVHLIGSPRPHGVAVLVDRHLSLGPVATLTSSEARLLADRTTVTVPADEVDEFRASLDHPSAGRAITFGDDVFPPTDVDGPHPVLVVDFSEHGATTRWEAEYTADGESIRAAADDHTNPRQVRRRTDEQKMWAALGPELAMVAEVYGDWFDEASEHLLRRIYQSPRRDETTELVELQRRLAETPTVAAAFGLLPVDQFVREWSLDPIEAAVLSGDVLPELVAGGKVSVDVFGDQPDYRRPDEEPTLRFSGDATTDWFDLSITLDVDGRQLPIGDVIAALARGDTHMLLPDDTYFPLATPALTTLRERLDEARELGDLTGDGVSSSTLNVTLWEELLELGVVDEQLAEWKSRLTALATAKPPTPITPPSDLNADLRGYQRDGLDWLTFLWDNGLGGILADDMGLGKTLQTLALFQHVIDDDPDARFLVVAPTSVVGNWAAEVRRFVPGLQVVTVPSTEKRAGRALTEQVGDAQIVVTSYALLRIDYSVFAELAWSGMVLDEAQFVKNHASKTHQAARRLPARFKLAITGTPLENRVMELWSLVSIVAPGLYSSPRTFKEHFADPIEKGEEPERLDVLRRRLRPIMLRRTKGQVLADLPAKQEQLLPLDLGAEHRKVYDRFLARERQKMLGLLDDWEGNQIRILRALTQLRQLSLHPGLVDEQHAALESTKITYLAEQIPTLTAEGHSALIFSSFTGFLRLVAARFQRDGIEYSYLDGTMSATKRAEQIEQFMAGDTGAFLISLKAGGFGLNLTAADYCFMTDPWWNPAAEAQAVDRAHRIGQQRAVTVYRMVSTGTVEEKVVDLQNRKRELFDALIDDGAAFSGKITVADVRGLLE
ncbi:DEAD/DEAH box helicase [Gordonia sp. HY285]|uniref:DEAD/DEAH box helicase n=1 Tax=Gordonia liuliyuniae TaxID=2911517 RepID=UPI001F2ED82B|nr:DEAD/DEAH box helicase [Gordonia liuliyuniae]MCF8611387.1 DEAD/DEAH box helicase [Gordonia liuliyuniae]